MIKTTLVLIVLLAICGCNNNFPSEKAESASPIINIKIDLSKSISKVLLKDILDSSTFCFLGRQSDCVIGEVDKILYHNNRYYILDKLQFSVIVFDDAGNFIFRFCQKGPGPKEYTFMNDFTIFEDRLCILDSNAILVYTLSGEYLKKVRLDFTATRLENIDDKYFAFFRHSNTERAKKLNFDLIVTDDNGNVQKRYFPYSDIDDKNNITTKQSFYVNNDEVSYIQRFNDTIYTFQNSSIAPKYVIDFGKYKIPSNPLENSKFQEFAYFIKDFQETSNVVVFSFTYSNTVYHAIYDKVTKEILCYRSYSTDDRFFIKGSSPVIRVDDSLVSIFEPYDLAALLQDLKSNRQSDYDEFVETYPQLSPLFKYIANEPINPIMIFEKYKRIEK
ncbi:MAG: 6-bladed beta-propeller [Draconibacterium sp.]